MKKIPVWPLLMAGVCCACAQAQNYPNRSIRLVVPWAAGGPPDAVGRLLGQRVGEAFKQQIVVDNRPGANSIIGKIGRDTSELQSH